MKVLKCKVCGGNLQVVEGEVYGKCEYCGVTMTIPRTVDDRILNLFNRANDYRLQNEFDKALATYESILDEDNTNAEAHWGCVLAKYGIEYVKDPKTQRRVPTCHRLQRSSVLVDLDYKKALEYADESSKELYILQATEIGEIQKRILAIANQEDAYDIFICYKETDENGKRTMDSVLAQDIYFQLQNEGYKVFFSRITLEDKLGQEYEPYIFAALNSAKIMLVIGTKQENFNAVWVKNEWSRFLALAKTDRSKLIIPCYRDMDAYDLPEELSLYQSQDMGRIGFLQDLLRGIGKVLAKDLFAEPKKEEPIQKEQDSVRIMRVEDVFTITGRGTAITGVIEQEPLYVNETIRINNRTFSVAAIEQSRKLINCASVGMSVGVLLKDARKEDVRPGDDVYKEHKSNVSGAFNTPKIPDDIARELVNAGYHNRKIEAIKILRERTGLGLAEAKDVIDRVFASEGYGTYTPTQKSGGCYVATAVYGSYDCPQVWTLRRYRDYALAEKWYGRVFIHIYYTISPTLVKWFGHTEWFKNMWRRKLDTMVKMLQEKGVESTPYEDRSW